MDRPKITQRSMLRGAGVPEGTRRDVQLAVLRAVKGKARAEQVKLDEKKAQSTPQDKTDLFLNPMQAVRAVAGFYDDLEVVHREKLDGLQHLERGVTVAETLVRRHRFDLKTLAEMDVRAIAELTSLDAAIAVKDALVHQDVALAMNDCFDNAAYSWGMNEAYSSDEHLKTELAELGTRLGERVKVARAFYRTEAERGTPSSRLVAQNVDSALEGLEALRHAGDAAIQVAAEHYAGAEGRVGVAGRVATAAGGILYEIVSAPARAVDEHISDEARGDAMASVALTALFGPAGGTGPRVEIGLFERGGVKLAQALSKPLRGFEDVAKPLAEMAKAFEESRLAARIDRWQDAINPTILRVEWPTWRLGAEPTPRPAPARAPLPREATEPDLSALDDTIDLGRAPIDPREVTRPIPRDWAPDPLPASPRPTPIASPPTRPTPLTEAVTETPLRSATVSARPAKIEAAVTEPEGLPTAEGRRLATTPRAKRSAATDRARPPRAADRNVFEVNGPIDPDRPNRVMEALERARPEVKPLKTDPELDKSVRALGLKARKDRA